jgi:thiol:disulfide interchange protein DsbC
MKLKPVGIALLSALVFSAQASDELIKKVKSVNNGRFATSDVKVLRAVPADSMKGLYEVSIDGRVLIMDNQAKFGVVGDLYDLTSMRNLTQENKMEAIKTKANQIIPTMPEDVFVTFKAKGETKATLTVFTDPTCFYCRKLHAEVGKLNEAGITVKYVPYPREGELSKYGNKSEGFDKTRQITCASDQQTAMTQVKKGTDANQFVKSNYENACEEQVRTGIKFGKAIGFGGTPFLHLDNGDVIPGFQEASALIPRMITKQ